MVKTQGPQSSALLRALLREIQLLSRDQARLSPRPVIPRYHLDSSWDFKERIGERGEPIPVSNSRVRCSFHPNIDIASRHKLPSVRSESESAFKIWTATTPVVIDGFHFVLSSTNLSFLLLALFALSGRKIKSSASQPPLFRLNVRACQVQNGVRQSTRRFETSSETEHYPRYNR